MSKKKIEESKKKIESVEDNCKILPQLKNNRYYNIALVFDAICEMFDDWRVVPRIIVVLYTIVFYNVISWFMLLEDPSAEQVAFVSAIVGAAAVFFGIYTNGGGKNNHRKE